MRAGASRATISPVAATVLIVDDHAGFRSLARALLEAEGLDMVGEAAGRRRSFCWTPRMDRVGFTYARALSALFRNALQIAAVLAQKSGI